MNNGGVSAVVLASAMVYWFSYSLRGVEIALWSWKMAG